MSAPAPALSSASPRSHPRVPLAPVLSGATLRRGAGQALGGLLDAPQLRHVTSGRIAIALALRAMGVGPGDSVLLPAYHSLSMVPPVTWCGATPRFYRVHADASADQDHLAALMEQGAKVLVATHFFGFQQDTAALRALCDRHGVQLLEDCAHCLFGERDGRAVGSLGDYAIGSTMKFFPVYEGGCLASYRHRLDGLALRSAGAGFEAKAALAVLEQGFAYGRMRPLAALMALPLALRDRLWGALKARRARAPQAGAGAALAPASSDSSYDFDPHWLDKRASLFTRLLLRTGSAARICARRRAHYLRWQEAIATLPGCRPLHPALPAGVCPWLFPLLVDDPEALCARLGAEGVPLTRFGETLWNGVDAATCANSAHLSRHVLGLACHQELRTDELDWMIERLRAALVR